MGRTSLYKERMLDRPLNIRFTAGQLAKVEKAAAKAKKPVSTYVRDVLLERVKWSPPGSF